MRIIILPIDLPAVGSSTKMMFAVFVRSPALDPAPSLPAGGSFFYIFLYRTKGSKRPVIRYTQGDETEEEHLMTDRDKVYTKVKKTIKQMLKLDHQGQVVTLAMMISGIVLSRKAQLSTMSSEVPSQAKDQSIEMRMRRWVKDDLDVEAVYMPFARQILEALSHLPLVLVMDGSQAGRGCMVLMVGVLYQKGALPIAWLVYKGKKGHASAERHIQVLEKVVPLLPKDSQVVLLGDAEYDTTEMLVWIEKNTSWQYVLRTSPRIYVQTDIQNQLFETIDWRKANSFI